jgi:phage-related tail fiber protein
VDQNSAGLSAKGAVAVATAGTNITLSGLQTIDGYAISANDRVLVKDQTLTQNNGIYVAVSGAWSRAFDMDAWSEVPQAYVFVSNGTVNSSSSWVCNSATGGSLGTTPITWVQFSQQAQVTAGAGMTRTGNQFDIVGTAGRIAVFADNVDIDSSYVGQVSITTLGTITTGTWSATTVAVNKGGTGATSLTGYVKGTGTAALTANATIPNTDITGLGTMSTQNAGAVAITGGSIDGVTFDMGTF